MQSTTSTGDKKNATSRCLMQASESGWRGADPKEIHGVSVTGLQLDSSFEFHWAAPGLQFLPTARISPHRSLGTFHLQAVA